MGRKGARDGAGDDVEAVLDELYALPPSDFVPRREERAAAARTAGRADDARRIHAARRPTLAAWAANLLRRSRPEEAQQFLELGRALREAYATLDPSGLKELSAQRRRIVAELSRQAARLARDAGHPLSDAVQRDVEETLRAVLADPEAADRWAEGRLESGLTPPAEFPGVSASGTSPSTATATRTARRGPAPATAPSPAPVRKKDELAERRRQRQEQARAAAEAAEAAAERLRDRRRERTEAEASVERARERRDEAERRVAEIEQQLGAAREELERADREQRDAEKRGRTAADALTRAEREAKEAAREAKRLASR
ncbi:hypothetical protein ACIHFC_13345 [Streptomyces sp. NPDC052013]|uniref:hypothetical protein n=1 Tax=Streptomyces sp. NPDC052013 TaxID=3365679 RepID=UPI0037D8A5B0